MKLSCARAIASSPYLLTVTHFQPIASLPVRVSCARVVASGPYLLTVLHFQRTASEGDLMASVSQLMASVKTW